MSNFEARILEAQARFELLRSIHSPITRSLPPPRRVTSEACIAESQASAEILEDEILEDEITLLRTDIRCLPERLQQIDIDQITDDIDLERLIEAFDSVLNLFEGSVSDLKETGGSAASPQSPNSTIAHLFPKLVALSRLRPQQDEIMPYIKFPLEQKAMAVYRDTIESFGKVIGDISSDAVGRLDAESRLREVTDAEVEYIQDADSFSKTSSSLFQLLVNCISCEAEKHVARLHLSGFLAQRLEMLLGTGEHDWIPALFTPSTDPISSEQQFIRRMCAHTLSAESDNRTIRCFFSDTMVWEHGGPEPALYDLATATTPPNTLDNFIRENDVVPKWDRVRRAIIGVFLACSLFRLCGSPWLQHGFEGENILVLPNKTALGRLYHWRPHTSCCFSSDQGLRSLPEDVAALGVLILELEARRSAGWTSDDEDYITQTRSNKSRLGRILVKFKGDLTEFYRKIGSDCFRFEEIVEGFEHPKIDPRLSSLAVLYKCIVNPLHQKLVTDHGETECLFQGTPGFKIPTRQRKVSAADCVVLYDDGESKESSAESQYANELMESVRNGFLENIGTLRHNLGPMGLAERQTGIQVPKKIRIAVLDTGIDESDKMIRGAKSRIKGKRSWVGLPTNHTDTYGHGTHVARVLIQMAPAAEIYIARISENKTVRREDMSRIAEAIDWAVEEWKVDIISMSFGFEDENKAIEEAIDRAFKADKLMFAAASNEGGNKGRSRPGRSNKVICVHACDGKGNKGKMSPNPVKKDNNFTALGVAVESRWKKETVYKSGTSFATPFAAAIAADVLEFANFKCNLTEDHRRRLCERTGMEGVLEAMSTDRDGYDYVTPGHLWDRKDDDAVAREIQKILAEL